MIWLTKINLLTEWQLEKKLSLIALKLFEVEFATSFLAENPDYGTEEAKAQLLQGIELMNSEKIYLISKLKFFKQKRTDLTAKKAMRGYDRFPKAVSMDDMVEIKEEEK